MELSKEAEDILLELDEKLQENQMLVIMKFKTESMYIYGNLLETNKLNLLEKIKRKLGDLWSN